MWVIINGEEHLHVKSLEEAVSLLEAKTRETGAQVRMITLDDYNEWEYKKTKRGKKSK